jgi:hypothetical protein
MDIRAVMFMSPSSLINGPLKRVNQSLAPLHERKAIE